MKRKNIMGNRYGKLIVIEDEGIIKNRHRWLCKCDCGNTKSIVGSQLTSGRTKSCGCLVSEKAKSTFTKQVNKEEIVTKYPNLIEEWDEKKNGKIVWNLFKFTNKINKRTLRNNVLFSCNNIVERRKLCIVTLI